MQATNLTYTRCLHNRPVAFGVRLWQGKRWELVTRHDLVRFDRVMYAKRWLFTAQGMRLVGGHMTQPVIYVYAGRETSRVGSMVERRPPKESVTNCNGYLKGEGCGFESRAR